MNADLYWKIIDKARAEAGRNDQEAMLKCTEARLAELPASEIAQWFNIHQLYLKLADRRDLDRAASNCGLYLSDDSFLYFRAWLLSLGKEAFYSVLNNPETLGEYIHCSEEARFESFVYVGPGAYTQKAFYEEYGPEGMQQWRDTWFAANPDKGEYGFDWALSSKYDIWTASAQHPLSEEAKEEIRKKLFCRSAGRSVPVNKVFSSPSPFEQALTESLPSGSANYRKLSVRLDSGYEWGSGMMPAAQERFYSELRSLFESAGWQHCEPKFSHACPEYTKGKSRLYCHPMEVSGPCEEQLIPEVCRLLADAASFMVTKAEDRGRVFDMTNEQYMEALAHFRPEIEREFLLEFARPNRHAGSNRHESVMMKYRVPTLKNPSDMLSSLHPYWKYTEEVLEDLIASEKIVKTPDPSNPGSRTYITSPEHVPSDKPPLAGKILRACERASEEKTAELLMYDTDMADRLSQSGLVDVVTPQEAANLFGRQVRCGDKIYSPQKDDLSR